VNSPIKPVFVISFFGVLLCLFVLLQVRLWVSEDGYREMSRLRSQVELQRDENRKLAERNARLDAEVKDLKRGFAAVEERARSDLGLIAPEESFYVFGDAEPQGTVIEAD
jgi:cell division protein FtsB